MADNWWGGATENNTPTFNAGDLVLSAVTGGLWGGIKTYGQTGDIGQAALYSLGNAAPIAINMATGAFGQQDADAVRAAQAAGEGGADKGIGNAVLEQAKAAKANAPYAQAGRDALAQQRALAGLDGPEAQQAALAQLENSPQFQTMMQQSEQAILANASATGGLRGGNVQQALAQNRPALLSQLIDQQYGRLGGLAGAGQQGSQFTAGLGAQYAGLLGDLYGQRASATSGGILGAQAAGNAGRDKGIEYGTQAAGVAAKLGAAAFGVPPVGGGF